MLHNLKIQVILPLLTACKFKIGKLHATCYADTISSPATELKQKYQCHTKILSMQHVPFCVNLYAYVPQFLAQNNFMYYYILLFSAVTKFWWLFSCLFATRIFSCMSACLLYNNLLGIDRNMCCGTHVTNLSQVQVNQFSLCFLILRACYFPHLFPLGIMENSFQFSPTLEDPSNATSPDRGFMQYHLTICNSNNVSTHFVFGWVVGEVQGFTSCSDILLPCTTSHSLPFSTSLLSRIPAFHPSLIPHSASVTLFISVVNWQ